jgi:CDP-4-dehydro-6-deoxyglucose reductase, E3
MSELLSLTRAARLVGVNRIVLQKKIQSGELDAYDGMVSVDGLLACFPDAQLEDTVEIRRLSRIKEQAFGKRIFERALPDAEVLAARVTELGKTLDRTQSQLRNLNGLLGKLLNRLDETECNAESRQRMDDLRLWIRHEAETAMEPGLSNLLAIKDSMLRVMAAHVTVLPSGHDFLLEGQDTLLEAAMGAGIPLNYGCSGGNCGLCKARVVSGEVKKTRHHDYVLSEAEKSRGCILLCSNTAVSDVTIEAAVAGSVQDIPYQEITAAVKSVELLTPDMLLLHLQTPRTQRLRFLAGQSVTLKVGQAFSAELPIASCPCDDRNVLFHVRRQNGHLFSDYVFDRLKSHDPVEIEGPQGEFILHEKSPHALYFFAFDGGFAPIKSVIEHAMSLNAESIHLHWIASTQENIYMPNVVRAWADALDNFHHAEHVAGFDLHAMTARREENLLAQLEIIAGTEQGLMEGDVYLAGPESAVLIAEQFFLNRGLPKARVACSSIT